jgi:hypothetical protein
MIHYEKSSFRPAGDFLVEPLPLTFFIPTFQHATERELSEIVSETFRRFSDFLSFEMELLCFQMTRIADDHVQQR